jgi:predicted permease
MKEIIDLMVILFAIPPLLFAFFARSRRSRFLGIGIAWIIGVSYSLWHSWWSSYQKVPDDEGEALLEIAFLTVASFGALLISLKRRETSEQAAS